MNQDGFSYYQHSGIAYWTHAAAAPQGYELFFLCRQGGFSHGPFASLNLSYRCGDDPIAVHQNRIKVQQCLGFEALLPVVCDQVHALRLHEASLDDAGSGWDDGKPAIAACDGLLTQVPMLPLAITTADCLPILLFSKSSRSVLALHAGWRGVIQNIVQAGITRAQGSHRVSPFDWYACIGPAIGPASFVIDGEVLQAFQAAYPQAVSMLNPNQGAVNLWQIAREQLVAAGVKEDHVFILGEDTVSQANAYFSHRREQGKTGRMMAFIRILS